MVPFPSSSVGSHPVEFTADSSSDSAGVSNAKSSSFGFEATHWSMVMAVGGNDAAAAGQALEELCKRYWKPLWKFVSWEFSLAPADAEDAVQGFLAGAVERGIISQADRERGKFRTFLFQAIKSHVLHEMEKRRAQKRGGGKAMVAATLPGELEMVSGQVLTTTGGATTEQAADREWAKTTLRLALKQLQADYAKRGQGVRCEQLQEAVLGGEARIDAKALAVALQMSEGQASVEVFRYRKRLREAFLSVVRDTVSSANDEEQESTYLLGLLAWA